MPSAWGSDQTQLFYELTPERVLSAVEDHQGCRATGRLQQLNSMENRVYQVEIELPSDFVPKSTYDRDRIVKFYRPGRWTREQISDEHTFLRDLGAAEVAAVAPLPFRDGETIGQVPGSKIYYAVFPRIGGRVPDEFSDAQLQMMGRLVARLHICGESREAEHRLRIDPNSYGYEHLRFLVDSGTIPMDLRGAYQSTVEAICTMTEPWFAEATYHRIHGDAHMGNILWADQGPFWVDFDDMLVGPAVQDIWLLVPGVDDYGLRQRRVLLDAYRSVRKFDGRTLRLIEPLRALRYIHFSAWIKRRYDDPSFSRAFPEFDTWNYWQGQINDLAEQLARIKSAA